MMKNNKFKNLFAFGVKKVVLPISLVVMIVLNTIPAPALGKVTQANLNENIKSGELEGFVDDAFKKNMQQYDIPGAVISIVKDGRIVFSKGYGYADLEKKTPVLPNKTLFRIASVTKLFTANAAMQLAENGEINLNDDVNKYLNGFKIKNNYPEKITMAQLLTHTSGIDSDVIGDLSKTESKVIPVSQFLEKRMLPVVREPGQFIQYSSYGIALAGCIVEDVSGMNCSDCINKNIFAPLGMANTSFKMNSPELAKGYLSVGRSLKPQELKGYFNLYPVGGIISTADDMAKFMIAHLNNGEYNGNYILKKDTAIEMHKRHEGFDEILPGTCYGFYERFRNGLRTIGHAGYSPDGFSTELSLFTDYNMGIFISINQGSNNSFPQDFINDFIDHYFSDGENNSNKSSFKKSIDKKLEGTYRFGEYTRSTLNKGDIFGNGEDVKVSVNKDGTITLHEIDPFTRKKTITIADQVSPMKFRKPDGRYVVFKQDKGGNIKYLAQTSDSWHGTYERINWYDENSFQIGLFICCFLIFLFEVVLWMVFSIRELLKRCKKIAPASKSVRYVNLLVGLNSLLNIAFYAISMMTWGERLRYGVPLDVKLLLIIPIVTSFASVALTAISIINWKNKSGSLLFRINTSAAAIIGLIFIWIYNYYNLLGFKY